MRFYDLETELNFGKHAGKTLQGIVKLDPQFIETAVMNEAAFFISGPVIDDLQQLNPEFELSAGALTALAIKHNQWKIDLDIIDEEEDGPYAMFDEQAWKDEFGMPDEDEEDYRKIDAVFPDEEEENDMLGNDQQGGMIPPPEEESDEEEGVDEDDAIDEFPYERIGDDEDDEEVELPLLNDDGDEDEDEWN